MHEADGRAVDRDHRHVGLHTAGVAGERLGVEPARRERRGRDDLQLAAAGEGIFDRLLVDGGVEREHAHGPAPAHVVVEGGAGLGIGIRADERARAGCRAAGRVAHVGGQPLIEERRLHEDAPREGRRRSLAERLGREPVFAADTRSRGHGEWLRTFDERFGRPGADRGEHVAAHDPELLAAAAPHEVCNPPAGQLRPEVTVAVEGEEVPGGGQLGLEKAAHVDIFDARPRGRMRPERPAGRLHEHGDLPHARHVGQLRRGDRHPRPAALHRGGRGGRDRGQPLGERPHGRHHAGPRSSRLGRREDRFRPGHALGVVDAVRERRGHEVDEIVDHEVADGARQEVVVELRIDRDRDLRAVPLAGLAAGRDRDGNPHEIERVARGVGGVVALVDPPELVQMVEIPREVVELERGLEGERRVGKLHVGREGGPCERPRAGDHDRVGTADGFVGGGKQRLDRVHHAGIGGGDELRPAPPARRRLQRQGHPQKRLVTAADRRLAVLLEERQLPPHLVFVFEPMPHEAILPPHVGRLGHDRAVEIDLPFEPGELAAQPLDLVVGAGVGAGPVQRLERGGEAIDEPAEIAGLRGAGGQGREAGQHAGHGDRDETTLLHRQSSLRVGPIEGTLPPKNRPAESVD